MSGGSEMVYVNSFLFDDPMVARHQLSCCYFCATDAVADPIRMHIGQETEDVVDSSAWSIEVKGGLFTNWEKEEEF